VIGSRPELNASAAELERIQRLRDLLSGGAAGLIGLLAMRTDPSWTVRREVVAALGQLGELALSSLCDSLQKERDDETRIAATVDALVASTGDADSRVSALRVGSGPAVLADVAQILGRRRNLASVPVLAELSKHADDNVAVAAIEGLGRVGGRAVIELLVQAVESRRFFRTFAAIDVLGKSGDPRAIAPLAALLDSAHYAFEAARALGRTSDRAAVAPLSELLVSGDDGHVRVAALALAELRQKHEERFGTSAPVTEALRRSAPAGATARLTQCLKEADPSEQIAILMIMGCIRDQAALPALLRALDGPAAVAKTAAHALEQFASDSDAQMLEALRNGSSARREVLLPIVSRSQATDAVVACLKDPNPDVRRLACDALARLGSHLAVPVLFAALTDPSPAVVHAATSAIQSLGHAGTPELAVEGARSATPVVRRAALRILSYLGRAETLDVLEAGTRDPDPRVREAAIQGLSLLESPDAVALLLKLALDASPQTRASAQRALGDCSAEPRVIERLVPALSDPEPWVRYYACQSLGKLQVESSVGAIARLVSDAAGQVRVAAVEALSHMRGDVAFAALREAAVSPELDLRRAALIGLGLSQRPESIALLLSHVDSEDIATRLLALSALAKFETPETLEALLRAAGDADENVQAAALGFIGSRAGAEASQLLAGLLKNPSLRERARAVLSTPQPHRVAGLLSALQSADDELALQLTSILARLNRPDATAALFEGLTLPNTAARRASATTLGAIGSREAYSALQRLSVQDADAEVRRVCSLLLAQ
jgi:HEAT repeat protein